MSAAELIIAAPWIVFGTGLALVFLRLSGRPGKRRHRTGKNQKHPRSPHDSAPPSGSPGPDCSLPDEAGPEEQSTDRQLSIEAPPR